jgi:hypothetical protein
MLLGESYAVPELSVSLALANRLLSVHRLDKVSPAAPGGIFPLKLSSKNTTGALLLAKSNAVAYELTHQFKTRKVGKVYLAIVTGDKYKLRRGSGQIRNKLIVEDGRVSISTGRFGLPAMTDWEVVATSVESKFSSSVYVISDKSLTFSLFFLFLLYAFIFTLDSNIRYVFISLMYSGVCLSIFCDAVHVLNPVRSSSARR